MASARQVHSWLGAVEAHNLTRVESPSLYSCDVHGGGRQEP